MSLGIAILAGALVLAAWLTLSQDKFGKHPGGKRLERIQTSPNYSAGEFKNTVPTAMLAKGQSSVKIMWDGLFQKQERLRPQEPLPTVKVDLHALDAAEDTVIWLGHSGFFIQLGGKRLLVDPVFSDYGAPFSFLNKAFPGTNTYTAEDMPELDALVISHDHWDHLDFATVSALRPKIKNVVLPLGVGAHFEYWGYPAEKLLEADWNNAVQLDGGLIVHLVPARHYSGRLFTRNKTLWAGFVLETPERRIFLSGDSGYGPHFAEIAKAFDGFDLAVLDGGQYDQRWPLIHMTPEEAVQATEDLRAKSMMLAHVGRFCIAGHPWDEPFQRVAEAGQEKIFRLITPKIGEPVKLGDTEQQFSRWWEGVQ